MVVRFRWNPGEWRELYLLATQEDAGVSGVPMAYLVAAVMTVGGVSDLSQALGGHREAILHDRLLPALLLVAALALLTAMALQFCRRRERLRGLPAVPGEEQQVTLHELGWAHGTSATETAVHGWAELRGLRTGRGVITLLTRDGAAVGLPLRALSGEQEGWVERLLTRKVPRMG